MALFDVANIKYSFMSNDGHSVRFLNRFGKFAYHRIRYQKCFSLFDILWINSALTLLVYYLGPYRFMRNKNFVKEARTKVEFSELSRKVFTKMKQF